MDTSFARGPLAYLINGAVIVAVLASFGALNMAIAVSERDPYLIITANDEHGLPVEVVVAESRRSIFGFDTVTLTSYRVSTVWNPKVPQRFCADATFPSREVRCRRSAWPIQGKIGETRRVRLGEWFRATDLQKF